MSYEIIKDHYESVFEAHKGDVYRETDWGNEEAAKKRYEAFAEFCWDGDSILDWGCNTGSFINYIPKIALSSIYSYTGIDISPKIVEEAKIRHPDRQFLCMDILK